MPVKSCFQTNSSSGNLRGLRMRRGCANALHAVWGLNRTGFKGFPYRAGRIQRGECVSAPPLLAGNRMSAWKSRRSIAELVYGSIAYLALCSRASCQKRCRESHQIQTLQARLPQQMRSDLAPFARSRSRQRVMNLFKSTAEEVLEERVSPTGAWSDLADAASVPICSQLTFGG
jgi:hypothetical protein